MDKNHTIHAWMKKHHVNITAENEARMSLKTAQPEWRSCTETSVTATLRNNSQLRPGQRWEVIALASDCAIYKSNTPRGNKIPTLFLSLNSWTCPSAGLEVKLVGCENNKAKAENIQMKKLQFAEVLHTSINACNQENGLKESQCNGTSVFIHHVSLHQVEQS